MQIVIVGASSFVGRDIVPILERAGAKLLLAGRDEMRLKKLFPNHRTTDYKNLAKNAKGFDTLVHLSVLNTDQPGSLEDFRATNVDFLKEILAVARDVEIKNFIYPTSVHALDGKNNSFYAKTKREAEQVLAQAKDIAVTFLRMPAVYSADFKGKLGFLSKVPAVFRQPIFTILASLKPTVHVSKVADAILAQRNSSQNFEIIVSDKQQGNWFYNFVKRVIDLGFSFSVILLFWWLFIVAWIAIRLGSKGPAIFSQKRVGKDGKPFTCYKFRTMAVGTKQVGTHEVSVDSVTPIGRFLRKTKVDELPQVWNIIKNELSLVGPRPCLPVQEELVNLRKKYGVLDEKGGITGWAQIKGIDMSDPERLARLDAEYLAIRGLILDLKIILATATGSGQGDKVSRSSSS